MWPMLWFKNSCHTSMLRLNQRLKESRKKYQIRGTFKNSFIIIHIPQAQKKSYFLTYFISCQILCIYNAFFCFCVISAMIKRFSVLIGRAVSAHCLDVPIYTPHHVRYLAAKPVTQHTHDERNNPSQLVLRDGKVWKMCT